MEDDGPTFLWGKAVGKAHHASGAYSRGRIDIKPFGDNLENGTFRLAGRRGLPSRIMEVCGIGQAKRLGGAVSIALLESPSQLLIPDWDTVPNESETQP